ncbi:hypothetical protein FIBSPDRAFT_953679 [Athelia psychrophila]|uniref:Uncharacterized protein n=1 Tax=Athelia psychrophila TaxID=1759441 RepID=A0A166K1A4_9AGAM|nr:hypothetical protein FIBSPDRAFT_953679 [Fibularhizoctonia sp. CBS 109695]
MKSITSSIAISVLLAYAVFAAPAEASALSYKRNSDIDDHLVYECDNVGSLNHYYWLSPDQGEKRNSDVDDVVHKRDGGPNHYYWLSPDQGEKRNSDVDDVVHKRDGGPNHYYWLSPDQGEKRHSDVDDGVHKHEERKVS